MDSMDRAEQDQNSDTEPRCHITSSWHWSVLLLAFSVSIIALAVAVRTQMEFTGPSARARTTDLAAAVEEVRASVKAIQQRLDERDTAEGTPFDIALAPLEGPGVRVTIDDSHAEQGTNLHDQDLLLLVNELRSADAEGIAINGQRLSATSPIRCTGPTIRVNGVALGPPYSIEAVGDPETLASALDLPRGIVQELRSVKIRVKVEKSEDLTLPSAPATPLKAGRAEF